MLISISPERGKVIQEELQRPPGGFSLDLFPAAMPQAVAGELLPASVQTRPDRANRFLRGAAAGTGDAADG